MTDQPLNDPDFDRPQSTVEATKNSSPLTQLPPKTLFFGGAVVGIMGLCTIGFFILLFLFLKG